MGGVITGKPSGKGQDEGCRDDRMLFYERFAHRFDEEMNLYDLRKRLKIVFEQLLRPDELQGKSLLDAGCGTGWFSQRAVEMGAEVTSLDVGDTLLSKVAEKCASRRVRGNILDLEFSDGTYDIVLATEVIEHTPDPERAFRELCRVLKPGGILVVTVPNRIWHFAVRVGNFLKLRPYEGFENWVSFPEIKRWAVANNIQTGILLGFHIVPFVLPVLYPVLDYFERFGRTLGPVMLNIGFRGAKVLGQR